MCFVVVIGLTLLMDLLVFRPLRAPRRRRCSSRPSRSAAPLQLALLKFDRAGKIVATLTGLNRPIGDGTLLVRWIWIVDVIAAAGALAALLLLLDEHESRPAHARRRRRLPHRPPARRAGEPAIFVAVVLSGALAAAVAVLMTAETPYVTPDYALRDTIIVLVGVVVGGIDRLWTATLGGFAIGFATRRSPASCRAPAAGRSRAASTSTRPSSAS